MKYSLVILILLSAFFIGCSKDHIEDNEDLRVATCGISWKDIVIKYGIKDTIGLDIHVIYPIENKKSILSGIKNGKFWVTVSNDSTHSISGEWISAYNFATQRTIENENEVLIVPNITINESIVTNEGIIFSIPLNARYNSYHDLCFIQDDKMNLVQNVKCHFIKQWYENSVITGLDFEKDPSITTRYNGFVFFNNGEEYYTLPSYFTKFLSKIDMINYFEGIINLGEVSKNDLYQLEVISNNDIISKYNFKDKVEEWRVKLSDHIECDNFTIISNLTEIHDDIAKFDITLKGANENERTRSLNINLTTGDVNLKPILIEKIELSHNSFEIAINDTKELKYKIIPIDATEQFTWETSDPKIASITNDTIKGLSEGEATISLKSTNGVVATCNVKVNRMYVENIEILPSNLQLVINEKTTIKANITPHNATNKNVTWTVSDNNIISIESVDNNTCNILGLKDGKTAITCTTEDGNKVATCKVIVKKILVSEILFDNYLITASKGDACKFNATINPANATDKTIRWSYTNINSSINNPISIDEDGNIEIIAENGTVLVTAQSEDGNAKCEGYIEIKPVHELIKVEASVKELIGGNDHTTAKITSSISNPTSVSVEVMNVMLIEKPTIVKEIQSDLGILNKDQKVTNTFKEFYFDNSSFNNSLNEIMNYLKKYFIRYQVRIDGEVFNIETDVDVFGN